jgi:hypothetical protein
MKNGRRYFSKGTRLEVIFDHLFSAVVDYLSDLLNDFCERINVTTVTITTVATTAADIVNASIIIVFTSYCLQQKIII